LDTEMGLTPALRSSDPWLLFYLNIENLHCKWITVLSVGTTAH